MWLSVHAVCAMQVDPHLLRWEVRLPLILAEIREAGADIMCFQELNHYGTRLAP